MMNTLFESKIFVSPFVYSLDPSSFELLHDENVGNISMMLFFSKRNGFEQYNKERNHVHRRQFSVAATLFCAYQKKTVVYWNVSG